jgi:hypothetical protein
MRKNELRTQQLYGVDRESRAREKQKVYSTIKTLERHMKRANRALKANVGEAAYNEVLLGWKQHLKWVRLHLVYFRPLPPVAHRRRAQRLLIDAAVDTASRGLRERGYALPAAKKLRHLIRLAVRYTRELRTGFSIRYIAEGAVIAQRYLADFVEQRVRLRYDQKVKETGTGTMRIKARKKSKQPKKGQSKRSKPKKRAHHQRAMRDPETLALATTLRKTWKNLSPIERGERLLELVERGCTQRGLAADLHQSPTSIRRHLEFPTLPKEDRDAIEHGTSAKRILKKAAQERTKQFNIQLVRLERETGAVSTRAAEVIVELLKPRPTSGEFSVFKQIESDFKYTRLLYKGMQRIPLGLKDPKKIIAACKPPIEQDRDRLPLHPDSAPTAEWVFRIADALTPTPDICKAALVKASILMTEHLKSSKSKKSPLGIWQERQRHLAELYTFSPVRKPPKD